MAAARDEKWQALLAHLHALGSQHNAVVVAFSGGADSAFLLHAARVALGPKAWAVTAVSPTMARSEIADAAALAEQWGLGSAYVVVASHELDRPGFAQNSAQRCALCKTELVAVTAPLRAQLGGAPLLLGTNTDDLGDYRPGLAAAAAHGALAPLVTVGLSKAEVRALSQAQGLRTWNKPQLACLSSRFPYGTEITPARLARVDGFEDALRALGFSEVRVRFYDTMARLELARHELARAVEPGLCEAIVAAGKDHGFTFVALDLAGFRSGSLNATLPAEVRAASAGIAPPTGAQALADAEPASPLVQLRVRPS